MCSLRPYIAKLLASLPPSPAPQDVLKQLVSNTLAEAKAHSSSENWKSQWEYLLKDEIFKLATREGRALKENSDAYYLELRDKLDIVLLFTEQDACEQTFPSTVLQDLLESQTIDSCSQVFSWIEDRAGGLTEGLVPQKGKALILLRTLNDLLRRLSKVGSTTIFCGRILTFLSAVFPLGERSGVNLRGEYGPAWEGVSLDPVAMDKEADKGEQERDGEDVVMGSTAASTGGEKDRMDVDGGGSAEVTEAERKADFYNTFWSLQLFFSKPTVFATPGSYEKFQAAINKVMPVIKEATAKERAMMGSRNLTGTAASLKRKREPEPEETNVNEYFFAKFLTSPELLDLEIADTHFRRQFLLQLLILLHHLLNFTPENKEQWTTPRNRSLQMDFTLSPDQAQWVQESILKVNDELRQTTPNGRQFSETVSTILDREKNWVKWKNELCAPFDKEPWSAEIDGQKVGLWDATKDARAALAVKPSPFPWILGSANLDRIWVGRKKKEKEEEKEEEGGKDEDEDPFFKVDEEEPEGELVCQYNDEVELETPEIPDLQDILKTVKLQDRMIANRHKQLAQHHALKLEAQRARRLAAQQQQEAMKTESATEPALPTAPIATPTTPKPLSSTGSAPLHPSLPPKPGTPIKSSQETIKPSTSTAPPKVETPPPATTVTPAPPVVEEEQEKPPTTDAMIKKAEEIKERSTWIGLRIARDQHLQHFGRIGTGDLEALVNLVEDEKKQGAKEDSVAASDDVAETVDRVVSVESSGDVKMEG